MTASPRTKAAKREARRRRNQADRAAALRLKAPATIGLVAAAELAVEEEADERARRDAKLLAAKRVRQSPMERYLARKEVSQEQYNDSERFLADFAASGLTATVTGSYGQSTPGSGQPTPGCGPRYVQYRDAMRAVGIMLSPVLVHVVIEGEPASQWALSVKRPQGEGIVALRLALDALGLHYRG